MMRCIKMLAITWQIMLLIIGMAGGLGCAIIIFSTQISVSLRHRKKNPHKEYGQH